jgi:hypothetical protein
MVTQQAAFGYALVPALDSAPDRQQPDAEQLRVDRGQGEYR